MCGGVCGEMCGGVCGEMCSGVCCEVCDAMKYKVCGVCKQISAMLPASRLSECILQMLPTRSGVLLYIQL